ncbi:N-acetyltransferase [Virgisporangium aliadipatigenens]|uniref:N-acetyltransferase n=1 Tax=Virgisporangium aliadipatigenens TaxID=741659 RepID=A0A8J3YTD1_9ACTN|nr:GNAT family N-acetyltransferase [Virgisporangium aliadipatigenens]GIJ50107.1 N-acetyltransferase [Virgisporangium aliadipatigenens]
MLGHGDVGHRVVVRHRVGSQATDALGELVAVSESNFTVRTRDGEVAVPRVDVLAAKRIPDRRARSGTERLESIAALGWPAAETDHLGDWLLRATDGWTARGNSALPVGDPGLPLPEAVDAVVAWYTARGLVPAITVPLPLGRRLTAELDRRGWSASPPTLVQTAPIDGLTGPPDPGIRVTRAPSEEWLAAAGRQKHGLPEVARRLLSSGPEVRFAQGNGPTGTLAAIGRGVVAHGWLGISVVGVQPEHRRQGWARRVTKALAGEAAALGATSAYLQVEAHNEAAIALYADQGFRTAHAYVTRRMA